MTEQPSRCPREEYIQPPHGFCAGCGVVLALRYFLKAIGDKVLFVMPPGCASPSVLFQGQVSSPAVVNSISLPVLLVRPPLLQAESSQDWRQEERQETHVVAWAGDGATFDIGFGAVSASAERNENIIYVCYDNEAYMNTGNQRSGATPRGAKTSTNPVPAVKQENKKDIMWIMMGTASLMRPQLQSAT